MNIAKLTAAINEAKRFLSTAELARRKWEEDFFDFQEQTGKLCHKDRFNNASVENATCKRASMDLTRALANLRKGVE